MVETANDGAYSYSWTFLWNVNGAVTLTPPADQTNYEGDTVSLSVAGTDSGGTPAYTAIGLPPGLRINAGTGLITGTVAAGASAYGPYTVTVYANDGTNGAEETFTWTVNDPITITDLALQNFSTGTWVDLAVSAADAHVGTLSYSAYGLPPGLSINRTTGAITGTIGYGVAAVGDFASTVVVTDGTYSASEPVQWDVSALEASACFAAGTPLLTPDGAKSIEEFRPGDLVLSRPETAADGPLAAKAVEAVFVRLGRVLHLHVGGEVLRTTGEHPFWVHGQGWVQAGRLGVGDLLVSHDGQIKLVEDVLDTGEYETVYNLRVADFHTYFVGGTAWGFSLWAHNAIYDFGALVVAELLAAAPHKARTWSPPQPTRSAARRGPTRLRSGSSSPSRRPTADT